MKTVCISPSKIQTNTDTTNSQVKESKALQFYANHINTKTEK